MPPKIKTRNIIVTEQFVEAMISYYSSWLMGVEVLAETRPHVVQRMARTIKRLIPIARRQSLGLHAGLDYEIARLRSMPYTAFDTFHCDYNDTDWMVGQTRHVTIHEWRTREHMGELGCYRVFVPTTLVSRPSLDALHMIPMRNPQSIYRHPHHYLINGIDGHPLASHTGNCFGSYAGVLKGLLDEPDIPEFYRQLYGHLCTYGDRPPMSMGRLDFDHDTPEEA